MPSQGGRAPRRLAPGTAKLRDRLSVWIGNSCGGGQVSSGSGGVGGADAVSYPTTTPCTPTATSRSTRPGQAASARLSGPGSLTVALPTPWSRPIGRRNGTTPRLGVFAALAGLSLSGVWGRRRRPPAPPATRWSGLRWQRLLAQGCLDGRRVPDRRRVDDLEDLDVITEAAAQAHRRPAATGRHRPWSSYAVSRSRGLGLIQRGGGFVAGRCRPRARRRRRCRVVGSRRSGGRAGAAWNQHPHPVGVAPSVAR
jgi:hypothetical protein